jgi:hypothetical protein
VFDGDGGSGAHGKRGAGGAWYDGGSVRFPGGRGKGKGCALLWRRCAEIGGVAAGRAADWDWPPGRCQARPVAPSVKPPATRASS